MHTIARKQNCRFTKSGPFAHTATSGNGSSNWPDPRCASTPPRWILEALYLGSEVGSVYLPITSKSALPLATLSAS